MTAARWPLVGCGAARTTPARPYRSFLGPTHRRVARLESRRVVRVSSIPKVLPTPSDPHPLHRQKGDFVCNCWLDSGPRMEGADGMAPLPMTASRPTYCPAQRAPSPMLQPILVLFLHRVGRAPATRSRHRRVWHPAIKSAGLRSPTTLVVSVQTTADRKTRLTRPCSQTVHRRCASSSVCRP